jgi:Domain of unknown function (DUF4253)
MSLTSSEKRLAADISFDQDICGLVKQHANGALARLTAFTEDYRPESADGLSIAVNRDEVESIIDRLQPELRARGYRAFWSETYRSDGGKETDEIAVLKGLDDFQIIRLRRTSGGNYDVTMEDIIHRLKSWRKQCQFEVVGAGGAWVAIQFVTLPPNICAFAEEAYQFCPDTVEQGVGLKNESQDPEGFMAARKLCPKLSEALERKLKERAAEFQATAPPQVRAFLQSGGGGFTTPTDMGIRLLAYELTQSHQMFLWWD